MTHNENAAIYAATSQNQYNTSVTNDNVEEDVFMAMLMMCASIAVIWATALLG